MKLLIACCFSLVACSHSPLDPGAGSSPGSGTNTLLVNGSAHAEPNSPNVSADTSFTTNIDVDISLNNLPVTTGTVTVISRTTPKGTALTFQNMNNNAGHWSGQIANYDEVYEFQIVSGADKVTGVYVDGPDIHVFTKPLAGAAVDVTMPLVADWSRQAAAQEARFSVNGDRGGMDGIVVADTGTYTVPALTLPYEKDTTKPDTLRLTRTNTVTPKGAVAGSSFSVSISNELDVVAMACPTCP